MEQTQVRGRSDLSKYDNSWYKPGAGSIKRLAWYVINVLFFINPLNPSIGIKVWLLRLFGASIGKGVVIKPSVNIKYPWRLKVGDFSWIGEKVWIDNLADVNIGNNCCLSQGSMLLTGNHDFRKPAFDLIVSEITLEDGAWVGAFAIVCPGTTMKSHSVLAVNSVATGILNSYSIYKGNPSTVVREREINE